MSGDGTDAPQDPNTDADPVSPPSDASVATPAIPPVIEPDLADPNSVVPDFEVPAPPTFGSAPPAPGSHAVVPDPVIPEPVLPPSAVPERVVPPAPLSPSVPPPPPAPRAEATPPAQAASGYTDANPYLEPGTAAPNSYRGWTVGIFTGLAVLLIGAIVALVYLFNNAPWEFAAAGESSVVETSTTDPSDPAPVETTATEPVTPASGQCGELCLEVGSTVGDSVTGMDGDVTWQLAEAWETAGYLLLPAKETVAAEYESSIGTLSFTVWGFEDDAAADDAFAELAGERGEPEATEEVYEGGVGVRNDYRGDGSFSVLWSVTGDESRPWVLFVEGPDDDAVLQFYYSLPI